MPHNMRLQGRADRRRPALLASCRRAPEPWRSNRKLKRLAEAHLAGDRDLVGRDASLEEVGEFLYVLQVHEREGIFCTVYFTDTKHCEALVGDKLKILTHVGHREPGDAATKNIFSKLHL